MKPIRLRLREATRPFHARLERTMGLDGPDLTRGRYGRTLQILHAVRAGWEPRLAVFLPDSQGPHHSWLLADLHTLGLAALEPAQPPPIKIEAHAWGVRYVLEGSALGGRVVLGFLAPLGFTAGAGARYFEGWGAETGARWAGFLDRLDAAASFEASTGIIEGAVGAFDALDRFAKATLSERPVSSPG